MTDAQWLAMGGSISTFFLAVVSIVVRSIFSIRANNAHPVLNPNPGFTQEDCDRGQKQITTLMKSELKTVNVQITGVHEKIEKIDKTMTSMNGTMIAILSKIKINGGLS